MVWLTRLSVAPVGKLKITPRDAWKTCENEITASNMTRAHDAIVRRIEWGMMPYKWKGCEWCTRRDALMVPANVREPTWPTVPDSTVMHVQRIVNQPLFPSTHFFGIGPEVYEPDGLIQVGTSADEYRKVVWIPSYDTPECVIYSFGSNNQFEFEEAVASLSKNCRIHVFDCTVEHPRVPDAIRHRVDFHRLCIGDRSLRKLGYATYGQIVSNVGSPTLLKLDIEGHEWSVLMEIVNGAVASGVYPSQIAVEMHYVMVPWSHGYIGEREMLAYFNRIFYVGGYVVSSIRFNLLCYHCAEILLVHVKCPQ